MIVISPLADLEYPSNDGNPMSEGTLQFDWIVTIKENLDHLFRDRPDVFVAGDNLWYPVEGQPKIRLAPDIYVVFGRPKGHRGSYIQHREGGVPLTVVFEVLSPSNTFEEMADKFDFYQRYGVEEYYVFDPDKNVLDVYLRKGDRLRPEETAFDFVSPRLGVRFEFVGPEMRIIRPDGRRFLTAAELAADRDDLERRVEAERERVEAERERAEAEHERAETERRRAEVESQRADAESQRADAERLRAEESARRTHDERRRADAEKERAEALAAELERLREQLRQAGPGGP